MSRFLACLVLISFATASPCLGQSNGPVGALQPKSPQEQLRAEIDKLLFFDERGKRAAVLAQRLVAMEKIANKPDSEPVANALETAFTAYYAAEDKLNMAASAKEAMAIFEKLTPKKTWKALDINANLRIRLHLLDKPEKLRGVYNSLISKELNDISALVGVNNAKGKELLQTHLGIIEGIFADSKIPMEELETTGHHMRVLSYFLYNEGKVREALEAKEKALGIMLKTFQTESSYASQNLHYEIAYAHRALGEYDQSELHNRKALAIAAELYQERHLRRVQALSQAAFICQDRGDKGRAAELAQQVVLSTEFNDSLGASQKGSLLGDAASVLWGCGKLDEALRAGDIAKRILIAADLKMSSEYCDVLVNQGKARIGKEQWKEAMADLRESISIAEAKNYKFTLRQAYGELAYCLKENGDLDGAEKLYAKVADQLKAEGAEKGVFYGSIQSNVADIAQKRIRLAYRDRNFTGLRDLLDKQEGAARARFGAEHYEARHCRLEKESLEKVSRLSPADYADWLATYNLYYISSDPKLTRKEIIGKLGETATAFERVMGKDYFLIPHVKFSLGRVLYLEEDFKRAEPILLEAVAGLDRFWPAPQCHLRTAESLYYLGMIQTKHVPRMQDGIRHFERAVTLYRTFPGQNQAIVIALRYLANARYWANDLPRAEGNAVELLDLAGRTQGKDSTGVYQARRLLGLIRKQQGDGAAALTHYTEARRLAEVLQLDTETKAGLVAAIGQSLLLKNDAAGGEKALREAIEMFKKGTDRPYEYGTAQHSLGTHLVKAGKLEEATGHFEEAIACMDQFPGIAAMYRNAPRYALASALADGAFAFENACEPAKANAKRQQALDLLRKIQGDQYWVVRLHGSYIASNAKWAALEAGPRAKVDTAVKDYAAAIKLSAQARNAEAFALVSKVTDEFAASLGKDDIRTALGQIKCAGCLYQLVRLSESAERSRAAIAAFGKILGENNSFSGTSYLILGNIDRQSGDPAAAAVHYAKARDVYAVALPDDHDTFVAALRVAQCRISEDKPREAMADMALAVRGLRGFASRRPEDFVDALASSCELSARLGDLDWAKIQGREALDYVKARKLEGTTSEMHASRGLALLNIELRDFGEAEKHARRWSELIRSHEDGQKTTALTAVATALVGKDDRTAGEAVARQVIDRAAARAGFDIAPAATARVLLAGIRLDSGDLPAAETYAQAAVEELERKAGPGHRRTLAALEQYARVKLARGDAAAAAKLRGQALAQAIESFDRDANVTTGDQLIELGARARAALYAYLSLPVKEQSTELAYNAILKLKGAGHARQRQLRIAAADPAQAQLVAQWRATGSALATEALTPPFAEGIPVWLQSLASRMEVFNSLETRLAAGAKPLPVVTIADIQKSLPADAVLVDYLRYPRVEHTAGKPVPPAPEYRYVAFVLKRGTAPVRIDLPNAKAVSDGVTEWQKALEELPRDKEAQVTKAVPLSRDIFARVSAAIWEPLQTAVGDATRLYVSPDGPLAAIPFPALPGSKPGTFLIEEKAVLVVPAARMLVDAQPPVNAEPSLMVVGQIDYGASPGNLPADRRGSAGGFTKLTQDHLECGAINNRFEKAFPKANRVYITEQQATEDTFRRRAAGFRWVHVSSHGFFDEKNTLRAVNQRTSLPGIVEVNVPQVAGEDYFMRVLNHPGLQCGIGFAGANVPNKPGQDDGVLTAFEAALLDLSGIETLVLSACQTGLGSTKDGEGVLGVQRAFHQAGVHSVVATLWSVPVIETIVLSDLLYGQLWAIGDKQVNALQNAQKEFIRLSRAEVGKKDGNAHRIHPYYWAGYSVSGDGK